MVPVARMQLDFCHFFCEVHVPGFLSQNPSVVEQEVMSNNSAVFHPWLFPQLVYLEMNGINEPWSQCDDRFFPKYLFTLSQCFQFQPILHLTRRAGDFLGWVESVSDEGQKGHIWMVWLVTGRSSGHYGSAWCCSSCHKRSPGLGPVQTHGCRWLWPLVTQWTEKTAFWVTQPNSP